VRKTLASYRTVRASISLAFVALAFGSSQSAARAGRAPSLAAVLAKYERAMTEPGTPDVEHVETAGTISGAGLSGTFHVWQRGEDEREDQNLGLRLERTLRLGSSLFVQDSNGNVRRLTGVLARRDVTQRFIYSGAFAHDPERCRALGRAMVEGLATYALEVSAPQGDTETLYIDVSSGLPDRIAYDDDDGRGTVDFSDWRSIEGHRFAFKSVQSDGDHLFDLTEIVSSVTLDLPIEDSVFEPLVPRSIEMAGAETLPLQWHAGHLFAPVRIGGRAYTFLVDSGAQDILIDKHVASDLKLRPIGALEASGASRTGGLQIVGLDELDVGSGRLRDLVVTTIDLGASTAGAFRIDGVLGYPFFATSTARLDVANRSLTFGPPGSVPLAGERIELQLDRSIPEAQVLFNGKISAPVVFDTGNPAALLLYKPFVERHLGIVPFSDVSRSSYGIGGETKSYRTALDELGIGSTPLYRVDTDVMLATRGAFADRFDAGNIGLGVLENFVVTFDYANGALYLEHAATFDDGRLRV
jgi:predicted aspartyl protease